MPALLKRTWSLDSLDRNAWAEDLIVDRSAKSRWRKDSEPVDLGADAWMLEIADRAFSLERAAI